MSSLKQHLNDVDETYFEHMAHASGFGWRMIVGGVACVLHGLFPFAFITTGSDCIRNLNEQMVKSRADKTSAGESA